MGLLHRVQSGEARPVSVSNERRLRGRIAECTSDDPGRQRDTSRRASAHAHGQRTRAQRCRHSRGRAFRARQPRAGPVSQWRLAAAVCAVSGSQGVPRQASELP